MSRSGGRSALQDWVRMASEMSSLSLGGEELLAEDDEPEEVSF